MFGSLVSHRSACIFHFSSKVEISYRQLSRVMMELSKEYRVSAFVLLCLCLSPESVHISSSKFFLRSVEHWRRSLYTNLEIPISSSGILDSATASTLELQPGFLKNCKERASLAGEVREGTRPALGLYLF